MKLLVVITSYRAKQLTLDCLLSLEGEVQSNPGMRVGICDNGNEDDTAEFLNRAIRENGWEDWCYVRSVSPNRGFSGGNNVILREALTGVEVPEFFLLLNADTIVRQGVLGYLLEIVRTRKDIGIIGPCLEDREGVSQVSCFRYISPVSELLSAARTGPITRIFANWEVPVFPLPEVVTEADWVSFACALIRREVFDDIGVLDEGYYLYFDDVDYCRSARNSGWHVLYAPGARVVHLEGQSNEAPESARRRRRRPEYWYFSRSWYFSKFYGKFGLFMANILWLTGRSVSLLREYFGSKKKHLCEREATDIWIGFGTPVQPRVGIESQQSAGNPGSNG